MKALEVYAIVIANDGKMYPAYSSKDLAGVKRAIKVGQNKEVRAVCYAGTQITLYEEPQASSIISGEWVVKE